MSKILNRVPLFYVYEVLERANEDRQRDGELSDLDISDSEDEDNGYISTSSSEEEEEEEE